VDISKLTSLSATEVESHLFNMICDGEIFAKIDKKTKIVNFEEPFEDKSEVYVRRLEAISERMLDAIGKSEDFIEFL
jgi:hypothetical protein